MLPDVCWYKCPSGTFMGRSPRVRKLLLQDKIHRVRAYNCRSIGMMRCSVTTNAERNMHCDVGRRRWLVSHKWPV